MYNILIHNQTNSNTTRPCIYVSLKPTSTSSTGSDSEVTQLHDPDTFTKTQNHLSTLSSTTEKHNSPSLNPRRQILLINLIRPELIPSVNHPGLGL